MGLAGDFVLIVVAGLAGAIAARALGLPLLVGYVAAGIVVGPHTAGPTVTAVHDIELLAEIGVALLLFALGLEVSFRDLRAIRGIALGGGPLQILICGAIGALAGRGIAGMSGGDALWFGAMAALSSTMVVLKTLAATGTQSTLASRVMIGLLVVQDLAVVPLLIVLPQVGAGGADPAGLLRAALAAAAFLGGMVFVGTRLLPALLRRVVRWGSRELFLVAVVAVGVGVGAVAHALGLSFAIGAFVAGVVLSESELSHQALSDVTPLRDIFGLLFFVSVGMLFDPTFVVANAGTVAALVATIVAGKAVVCGVLARLFGYGNLAPWIIGLGLSQIGEFSFVLARVGRNGGFLSSTTYDLALSCTVLSMALSPLVFPGLLPVVRAWARRRRPAPPAENRQLPATQLENHAIVAGYGRTGRAVVESLREQGRPCVIVESRHEVVTPLIEHGDVAIWGDITSEEILRAAGVPQARMLVMAMPDGQAIEAGIARARQINPRLFVIARATTAAHVHALRDLHVNAVVQPEFEGGLAMVRQVLTEYGAAEHEIDPVIADVRQRHYDEPTGAAPSPVT